MKTFEYVTILFSIMLGFCFTQMASNFVLVVQHFGDAKLYAPSILWNAAALIALFGHWVHFYKAANINQWNVWRLTLVALAPLIYFIPAQLITQSPIIEGRLNFEVIFDSNKKLIYISVILFVLCIIAQHYFIYNTKSRYLYGYYLTAIVLVAMTLLISSKTLDLLLAIGIVIAEILNHYVFNPLTLNANDGPHNS